MTADVFALGIHAWKPCDEIPGWMYMEHAPYGQIEALCIRNENGNRHAISLGDATPVEGMEVLKQWVSKQ